METVTFRCLGGHSITIRLNKALNMLQGGAEAILYLLEDGEVRA